MNNFIKKLLRKLPDSILFGESYRYGKRILTEYNNCSDKTDFIASYQQQKLDYIFKIASKAPFYRHLNSTSTEIDKLPFIDRDVILQSGNEMIVEKKGADCVSTGGTSGNPLRFYINKSRKGFEWFWMLNNWSKVGFTSKDYRAVLRNHVLKGKNFSIDPLLREYRYDNFRLSDEYLDFIVDHTKENQIRFLHAYPSAAYILANRLQSTKKNTSLKIFLCGSENVFAHQKTLIQNRLKLRMYTWFGHTEKLILAPENNFCENYHSNPFYGYTEIIDENGNPVKTYGTAGELVGTGFINTKMPFIRYRTGDLAEYVGDRCPDCGHNGITFRNVIGGWDGGEIYKSDGTVITITALDLHSDIYNYIKTIQYVQEEKGFLIVRVIPHKIYNPVIRKGLLKELESKGGKELKIEIVEVSKVEYTKNNKFKLLIQRVKK